MPLVRRWQPMGRSAVSYIIQVTARRNAPPEEWRAEGATSMAHAAHGAVMAFEERYGHEPWTMTITSEDE